MVTIDDLPQEQELSSSDKRKAVGAFGLGGSIAGGAAGGASGGASTPGGSAGTGLKGDATESDFKDWIEMPL
jgi:hypothetical protein